METSIRRLSRQLSLFLIPLLYVLILGDSFVASARIVTSRLTPPFKTNHRDTNRAEILSILEAKVGSRNVTEKIREKMFTLSDNQIRLIASLAELVANGGQAAGSEIVFFVMTILIVA